jgi:hypothetical protein
MGIDVNQRDTCRKTVKRAHDWNGNAVVAAQGHQCCSGVKDFLRRGLRSAIVFFVV